MADGDEGRTQMRGSRNLVDITLEEAIEVLKLGEGFHGNMQYRLRVRDHVLGGKFAQLFYVWNREENIAANFSHDKNAVSLCHGNTYYRTMYRVIKYLEGRGFDLEGADKAD